VPDLGSLLAQLSMRGAGAEEVYARADLLRKEVFGDTVHLRALLEISNHCSKNCFYCGIRKDAPGVTRYAMSEEEILKSARRIAKGPCRTLVLQSGEAGVFGAAALARLIERIRGETGLAVTLSCGVRPRAVYAAWQAAGMDRYLLRFETSDPALYSRLHPDSSLDERLAALADLRDLGVQVGSGFLIGAPGETPEILAQNILLCRRLDLDMIGVGPFIPHPETPLAAEGNAWRHDPGQFFIAMAVLRLCNPRAYIPATTAFDTLFGAGGRMRLLRYGANVYMPNFTPKNHSASYALYPGKAPGMRAGGNGLARLCRQIEGMGLAVAKDAGHALLRASECNKKQAIKNP
jgi:biotin synthase